MAPQPRAGPRHFAANGNLDLNPAPPTPQTPALVLHSSAPYLIFWDPGGEISTHTRSLLARYFGDVAADSGKASNVYGVARQYYDSSGFADYRQAFGPAQAISDAQPYPAQDVVNCPDAKSAYPTCVSDAQEQAEISRLIAAGGLPSGTGANAPIYFVITPPDVNVCTPNGVTPACADNLFCAYHSSFPVQQPKVLYAAIPMLSLGAGQNPKACQFDQNPSVQVPNGAPAGTTDAVDVVIKAVSHEDNETITDPTGTGWWDSTSGNEDGDNCNAAGSFDPSKGTNPNAFIPTLGGDAATGTLSNQLINAHLYYLQSEWSNGDANCEMRPSAGTVTAAFGAPASPVQPGTAVQFNPGTSSSSRGYSSSTWDFGDGSTPAFSPASGPVPVEHVFATPGRYAVTLTLVDPAGNLSTVTHLLTVGTPPTASFASSPARAVAGASVRFSASGSSDHNSGGVVTRWFWNFGDGAVGTGASASHVYASPGIYTATLVVADQYNLPSAPVSRQVTVDEPPVARPVVGSAHPQAGLPISFRGSSSRDPDGSIRSYRWRFGDGSGAAGRTVTHIYGRPGTYLATLTVTDSANVTATTTVPVTVGARITRISVQVRPRTRLLVRVNGAGVLRWRRQSIQLRRAGTAGFPFSLTPAQSNTLAQGGALVLTVRLEFTPAVGAPQTTKAAVTVRG